MIEQAFAQHEQQPDAPKLIATLVAELRPTKSHQTEVAVKAIQALCFLLNSDANKAKLLREAILQLLAKHKPISLYLIARHSVFTGFFSEMRRRISHKFLPEAINEGYLIDLFARFFTKNTDAIWVSAVPNEVWQQLIVAIGFQDAPSHLKAESKQNLLAATQVLSYRIAALGLEPELLRNHPELEQYTSPFLAQHAVLSEFLISINTLSGQPDQEAWPSHDIDHILVMLSQSSAVISKIHRNSAQVGTSIQLTHITQQMTKQIARLELLLRIFASFDKPDSAHTEVVSLFKQLVYSECHKNDVSEHWHENMEVMALRVTENASRTGEHYITDSRPEYFGLMRSAMGAGVIIALMAMLKILLSKMQLAPLTEAILFSLNYGLGFILIHILHFTVATKQPAMTAAAIAASIDAADSQSKAVDNLVAMIANTTRSQMVAIFGNVVLAIPVAMLLAWITLLATGTHFITPDKAHHLLESIDPFNSGALIYAGIAGVCLFLSGLIAGYHDNMAIYNKIPQRLRALSWLQLLLGKSLLARVANYIENNLGALAGNFYFGCLLGGMTAIGVLFGLPFDIRHIAFSSAFVGFAAVGLEFMLTWQAALYAALGLVLIGLVNLSVSFSLALYVAMKSRGVRFKQWRLLIARLATRLNQHPAEFVLPPKKLEKQSGTHE